MLVSIINDLPGWLLLTHQLTLCCSQRSHRMHSWNICHICEDEDSREWYHFRLVRHLNLWHVYHQLIKCKLYVKGVFSFLLYQLYVFSSFVSSTLELPKICSFKCTVYVYVYVYAFSRRFYPKRLTNENITSYMKKANNKLHSRNPLVRLCQRWQRRDRVQA